MDQERPRPLADRLNGGLVVGYFLTPALSVNLRGSFQNTYGGLSIDHVFGPHASEDEFLETTACSPCSGKLTAADDASQQRLFHALVATAGDRRRSER